MKKLVNIYKLTIILLLILFSSKSILAQETKTFSNLNEVLDYSKTQNYSFENAKFQTQLAVYGLSLIFN